MASPYYLYYHDRPNVLKTFILYFVVVPVSLSIGSKITAIYCESHDEYHP